MASSGNDDAPDDVQASFIWDAVDLGAGKRAWKLGTTISHDVTVFNSVNYAAYLKPTDTYVRLSSDIINRKLVLTDSDNEQLVVIYLSHDLFTSLKGHPYPEAQFGTAIPVRDARGLATLAKPFTTAREHTRPSTSGQAPKLKDQDWAALETSGLKAISTFNSLRFVNPNIDVILVPTSNQISLANLDTFISSSRDNNVKQTVTSKATVNQVSSDFVLVRRFL